MSDQLGNIEVTTNGTRAVTDAEPPKTSDQAPASFVDGPSVDERLDCADCRPSGRGIGGRLRSRRVHPRPK